MDSMVNTDYMRDPQEERPIAHCSQCHDGIYAEETAYIWEGREICVDCFRADVTALLENNPDQVALEMGLDTVRYP